MGCLHCDMQDFGLAHLKGTEDAMVGLFGSLDYIAPEALTKREYCAQTDTWAVGVILYILLCGYVPKRQITCWMFTHPHS